MFHVQSDKSNYNLYACTVLYHLRYIAIYVLKSIARFIFIISTFS